MTAEGTFIMATPAVLHITAALQADAKHRMMAADPIGATAVPAAMEVEEMAEAVEEETVSP